MRRSRLWENEQVGSGITRQIGGLGLGLAICKALMDLHGGSIRAENAGVGEGPTFVIQIPDKMLTATARMISRLLTRAGFTVVSAPSVASALAIAKSEPFDVLVSDLGLPDGTGHEVMKQVRALHRVPGIAMGGYGMEEHLRRSRNAGFIEHLVKPIQASQLFEAIRRVVR